MFPPPAWLPEIVNTDGVWEKVLKMLYEIFKGDFITDKCFFNTFEITYDDRKIDSPYEEGFWHLISKDDEETGERLPDFPRAQRLPWCKPIIINHKDSLNVRQWDYIESNGRINTYFWLENLDYVVIVQKRNNEAKLVTAHYIEGSGKKRQLLVKYKYRVI